MRRGPSRRAMWSAVSGSIESLLTVPAQGDIELSVVADDKVIATTAALAQARPVDVSFTSQFEVDIGGDCEGRGRASSRRHGARRIDPVGSDRRAVPATRAADAGRACSSRSSARRCSLPTWHGCSRRELEELSEGARAMAEGRFDMPIPVRSKDEVGQLGHRVQRHARSTERVVLAAVFVARPVAASGAPRR